VTADYDWENGNSVASVSVRGFSRPPRTDGQRHDPGKREAKPKTKMLERRVLGNRAVQWVRPNTVCRKLHPQTSTSAPRPVRFVANPRVGTPVPARATVWKSPAINGGSLETGPATAATAATHAATVNNACANGEDGFPDRKAAGRFRKSAAPRLASWRRACHLRRQDTGHDNDGLLADGKNGAEVGLSLG